MVAIHRYRQRESAPTTIYLSSDQVVNGMQPGDLALANRMNEVLQRHYPGHPWNIYVDSAQGVAVIKHQWLSDNFGYTLHLHKLDVGLTKVRTAGGELLERYNMRRAGYERAAFVDARPVFSDHEGHNRLERARLVNRLAAKPAPLIVPPGAR